MTMPNVAICATLDCKSSMFTLIFLQNHLEKLFQHVVSQWVVGPVDGRLHYVEKLKSLTPL